jgi:hypothetical protein
MGLTNAIIGITAIITLAAWRSPALLDKVVFFGPAISVGRQKYRFFSYGFVHADFWHLAFNMFTLWSFGSVAEEFINAEFSAFGPLVFVLFYVVTIAVSIIPSYVTHKSDSTYVSLGASGAVSAVLAFVVISDPTTGVYVYGLPMTGWQYLLVFVAVSIYLGRRPGSRVNHSAHLVGTACGLVFAVLAGWSVGYNVVGEFITYVST